MAYKPATFRVAPPSAQGKNPKDTLAETVGVMGPSQKEVTTKKGERFYTHRVMKHGVTPFVTIEQLKQREEDALLAAEIAALG